MKYLTHVLIILFITSCFSANQLAVTYQNHIPIEESIIASCKIATQIPSLTTAITLSHESWNKLLKKHVSDTGQVNYNGFITDKTELKKYIQLLSENTPIKTWSKNDKLAYWINAYNALTIDLIIQNYPVKSIKDIKNPWKQSLWTLGNTTYNLEEIEHEILRKMNEPRIHFAIVCASYSCPKLQNKAYTGEHLELQLTNVTKEFLADKNRNEISKSSIKISKIFDWFTKDFTQNGSLIDFLNQYSEVTISSNAKKSYKEYNWALNE